LRWCDVDVTSGDPRDVIAAISDPERRSLMDELDTTIRGTLPTRSVDVWTGLMWGGTEQTIIGYGRIVQPRPSGAGVRWFLIGLAAQRRAVSVYVNAVRDGNYLLRAFEPRLGRLQVGSASLSIRSSADLDRGVFVEMCEEADRVTPEDQW
jgi:hypothetical protein